MKIVVILGRVLDPAGIVVNRRRGRIFVNREEYVMQPADACALEAALRIKDGSDAEVIALPHGLLPDDDVLRQALSMGADRAIHFVGQVAEQLEGSPLTYGDAVMARVLAAAVERLGDADLVLVGATTLDTGQSQLGSRLAEALGWPQIVEAWAVRVVGDHVETVCYIPPPLRGGLGGNPYAILEADLPAVVTVHPGALKLRYPDGTRLINVYRDERAVEVWDATDLVDADILKPLLEKRGQDFPPERERGVWLEGAPQEMAQALASELRKRVGRRA
jgi:electron transfer flavoprotein beta subunit